MTSQPSDLSLLFRVPEIARLAGEPGPWWLWSADGARLLAANAGGARAMGASGPAFAVGRDYGPSHPFAGQILRFAPQLPADGTPRTQRVRLYGRFGSESALVEARRIRVGDTSVVAVTIPGGASGGAREAAAAFVADLGASAALFDERGAPLAASRDAEALAGLSLAELLGPAFEAARAELAAEGAATVALVNGPMLLVPVAAAKALLALLPAETRPEPQKGLRLVAAAEPEEAAAAAEPEEAAPAPAEPAAGPVEASAPPAAEAPVVAEPAAEPVEAEAPAEAPVEAPPRFSWRLDAEERFHSIEPESVAAPAGLAFAEAAARFGLDESGALAKAIEARKPFSGVPAAWPLGDTRRRLSVTLAAFPSLGRDGLIQGYAGFGLVLGELPEPAPAPAEAPEAPAADAGNPPEAALPEAAPEAADDPFPDVGAEAVETTPEPPAPLPPPDAKPVLTVHTTPPNVVALRPGAGAEAKRGGTLSPVERNAFREIAKVLGAHPDEEPAASEPPAPAATSPVEPPASETPEPATPEVEPAVSENVSEPAAPEVEPSEAAAPEAVEAEAPADRAPEVSVPADRAEAEAIEIQPEPAAAAAEPEAPEAAPAPEAPAAPLVPGLAEAGTPFGPLPSAFPASPVTPPAPAAGPAAASADEGPLALLLDRVPLGLLVHRGNAVLFANRTLLDWTGHPDAAALERAGGVARVFAAGIEPAGGADGVSVTGADGMAIPVEARLSRLSWAGEPAFLFTLTRVEPGRAAEGEDESATLAELRGRLDEVEQILDTATDGIVIVTPDGAIESMNRSAEALFGYESAEVKGRNITVLFAPESHRSALDYCDGLMSNGVASVLNDGREIIGRVRQGGLIPLYMTMGRTGPSARPKLAAVFRDMTQWKKAEEDLVAARRQAEHASSQKSDFLAKISHEIRTPLNAIIGFSEVMMEERFGPVGNERYRDYLRDIHASGGHVLSLINDLLDLSKIEAGKLDLAFTSVDLNDIVQSTVAIMQPQANRERVIIRSSLHGKLPNVVADARSLRQIVLNLLSNSVKFTPAGGQIIVSTALSEAGEAILRVRDTGVGMTEAELKAAMEPFRQVSTSSPRMQKGTGLGLPLTKALVEANRASFGITSTPNQGTLVEVIFPPTRVLAE